MAKPLFDAAALIDMYQNATAQQGEQLRKAVSEATLQALQGRELTLKNIRAALKGVTDAVASARPRTRGGCRRDRHRSPARQGRGRHGRRAAQGRGGQPRGAGPAGGARRRPARQAPEQGAGRPGEVRGHADGQRAQGRRRRRRPDWPRLGPVLEKMQAGGTLSGSQATATAEKLVDDMQAAMRSSRAASLKAAQAMAESYTAMVSGVLLGMSEALQAAPSTTRAR
jgi:hypothetical protein